MHAHGQVVHRYSEFSGLHEFLEVIAYNSNEDMTDLYATLTDQWYLTAHSTKEDVWEQRQGGDC